MHFIQVHRSPDSQKRALKRNFLKNFLHSFLAVTAKVLCRWCPVPQVDKDARNYLHIKSRCLAQLGRVRREKREARKDFNTNSCSTKGNIKNCPAGGWEKRETASAVDSLCLFSMTTRSHLERSLWKSHVESTQQALAWQLTVNGHVYLLTSSKPLETCIIDGTPGSRSH